MYWKKGCTDRFCFSRSTCLTLIVENCNVTVGQFFRQIYSKTKWIKKRVVSFYFFVLIVNKTAIKNILEFFRLLAKFEVLRQSKNNWSKFRIRQVPNSTFSNSNSFSLKNFLASNYKNLFAWAQRRCFQRVYSQTWQ